MGSVVLSHVPLEHIDRYKMLGGTLNKDSVYSRTSQLEGPSRSTSNNTTPTSTTAPPAAVGSARVPAHVNDLPAYINSQTPSQSSTRTPPNLSSQPPPSMTSHPNYAAARDHASYSNTTTPQYPQSGHVSSSDSMTSAPNQYPQSSPDSPRLHPTFRSMQSLEGSEANSPSRIRVQSLSHIQSLASEELLAPRSQIAGHGSQQRQYEISSMPVTDIIEMVAGLLTKITSTNDMHHEHVQRHIPPPEGTGSLSPQASSVLAFHGKNVPSITILSYLTRIHKYCPTTYEVFLSLLVYFDRMTELVNRGQHDRLQHHDVPTPQSEFEPPSSAGRQAQDPSLATPPSSAGMKAQDPRSPNANISPALYPQGEDDNFSHFFVVDSFNIHRLVIAGVTCASKFFSDVFYTNSRYAKVCSRSFGHVWP